MLRNKTTLSILAGLVLALAFWAVVILTQKNKPNLDPQTSEFNRIANVLPVEHAMSPASIQSVKKIGDKFTIMGTGGAGANISLRSAKDNIIADTKVDGDGFWVITMEKPNGIETLKLNIHMATPDGRKILSDQALFILSHQLPRPQDIVSNQKSLNDHKAMEFIILTAPGANSRVLQSAFEQAPSKDGFVLEAIDYDNSGGVIFSGSSVKPGKIRILTNDNLLGESHTGANGRWSLIFGNIMPLGEYTIRAELTPKDGEPAIKLTLPFSRMRPLFEAEASPKIFVQHFDDHVQMGRLLTGGGYQYLVVYAQNAVLEE